MEQIEMATSNLDAIFEILCDCMSDEATELASRLQEARL